MPWKPDYIELEQAKNFVRIPSGDTLDDAQLAIDISTASRAVDKHCNRQFGQLAAPATRRYTGWYDLERGLWVVDVDDVQDTTGLAVTVSGTTVDPASVTPEPLNAVDDGLAYTRLVFASDAAAQPCGTIGEAAILLRWGWLEFPTEVVFATRLQVSRFASRRDSPYGVAGSPSDGSELRLLARLDPDVAVGLAGLRRPRKLG